MSPYPTLRSITIRRLYGEVDLDLSFHDGLNVLYGRNGRGKTALLHVIANACDLDFSRFLEIDFEHIEITTSTNSKIRITTEQSDVLVVLSVAGSTNTLRVSGMNRPDAGWLRSLRKNIGDQATYFPAFRSILERATFDTGHSAAGRRSFSGPELIDPNHREAIYQSELNALTQRRDSLPIDLSSYLRHRDMEGKARAIASKTIQCRKWFGPFIPVIRYPSIDECDQGMSAEWEAAYMAAISHEREMHERVFSSVITALSHAHGSDSVLNAEAIPQLKAEIKRLASWLPEDPNSDRMPESRSLLLSRLEGLAEDHGMSTLMVHVLTLYRDELAKRSQQSDEQFRRCNEFVRSVNRFLIDKQVAFSGPGQPYGMKRLGVVTQHHKHLPLGTLSSGERHILTMLFLAFESWYGRGPILIDEPELSLHVDWQRVILSELGKQVPGRQIIACTHSPEVGADDRSAVQILPPRG